MVTVLGKLKMCGIRVLISGLVCLVGPTLSWAVNIGGQVVPADQTNNQPTLKIQVTAIQRSGTASGGFDYNRWKIGAFIPWGSSDANPPFYTEADNSGNFVLPIRSSFTPMAGTVGMVTDEGNVDPLTGKPLQIEPDSLGNPGLVDENGRLRDEPAGGAQENSTGASGTDFRFAAGYGGHFEEFKIDDKSWLDVEAEDLSLESKWTIRNFSSTIDWWTEGLNIPLAEEVYQQAIGNTGIPWENYFGDGLHKPWLSTASAPPTNEVRGEVIWNGAIKDDWEGSENNAVTNTAPAQGLYPHTWAIDEEATPVASVYFRRSDHE